MAFLFRCFFALLLLTFEHFHLSNQTNELENEFSEFMHRNPLPIEHRITLVQLIFEQQTELLIMNMTGDQNKVKEAQKGNSSIKSIEFFANFPYAIFISKIKNENFDELTKNLWQNAQKLAKIDAKKYHFLIDGNFYEQFIQYLAKIVQIKVEKAYHSHEKNSFGDLFENENSAVSAWKCLQIFVEMYSLGLELFMQVAGISNYMGKYPKKTQKSLMALVSAKMPQLDEISQQFFDFFQGKFVQSIPQKLIIEPLDAQKIIRQNDTCLAWSNWFNEIGGIKSEKKEKLCDF